MHQKPSFGNNKITFTIFTLDTTNTLSYYHQMNITKIKENYTRKVTLIQKRLYNPLELDRWQIQKEDNSPKGEV